MSTQHQHQQHASGGEMYAGRTENGKERIATEFQIEWFKQVLEQDLGICNNCFSKREDAARHFRPRGGATVGGGSHHDATADLFCKTCEAGTGKDSLHREYEHIVTGATPRLKSESAGTVGRDWSEGAPLPKNGRVVSFNRLITRIGQRLEEAGYEIADWDGVRARAQGLKDDYPARDRVIFARVFSEAVDRQYASPGFKTVTVAPSQN